MPACAINCSICRERADRLEAELAEAQQELAEVAVQEEAMRAEEDDYWRRYDALCLDLHVCSTPLLRPWLALPRRVFNFDHQDLS